MRRRTRNLERDARRKAIEAAIGKLSQIESEGELSDTFFHRLRLRYDERLGQIKHRQSLANLERYDEVEDTLVETERAAINALLAFADGRSCPCP